MSLLGPLFSIPSTSKPLLFLALIYRWTKQCRTQPRTQLKGYRYNQERFFKVTSLTNPRGQPGLPLRRTQLGTVSMLPSQLHLEAHRSSILTSESTSQFFPKQVYRVRINTRVIESQTVLFHQRRPFVQGPCAVMDTLFLVSNQDTVSSPSSKMQELWTESLLQAK